MKNWLIKLLGGYLKEDIDTAKNEVISGIYVLAIKQRAVGLLPAGFEQEEMVVVSMDDAYFKEVTVH